MASKKPYNVISFSGGKDSTAMLHLMLEKGESVDEVMFFDTGWEFPEMYDHIKLVEQKTGIKITVIKPEKSFEYYFFEKEITRGKNKGKKGYGFPFVHSRWCTRLKMESIAKYKKYIEQQKDVFVEDCVGIAYDEQKRIKNKIGKRYPLNEYSFTEKMCLEYCYNIGYRWNGLYDHLKRVSCFCCPMSIVREKFFLYTQRPELWKIIKDYDQKFTQNIDCVQTIGFKNFGGKSVHEWERYFEKMKQKQQRPLLDLVPEE